MGADNKDEPDTPCMAGYHAQRVVYRSKETNPSETEESVMPYVQGPGPAQGPQHVTPRVNSAEEVQRTTGGDPQDAVQISELARFKAKLAELPEIREDLVAEIKDEIENGTYDTEEKVNAAVERIYAELREEGEL